MEDLSAPKTRLDPIWLPCIWEFPIIRVPDSRNQGLVTALDLQKTIDHFKRGSVEEGPQNCRDSGRATRTPPDPEEA